MSQALTGEHAAERAAPPLHRWRWLALFVVLAAEIMDLLDALITTIAGPSIRAGIGGGESLVQWLGAGYTIAMASGLIVGGRLGDMFGRKRMFMIGAAGFTVASLLCAVAQSPEMLIGARLLQGLLGAVMLPQGLGVIKEIFPPKELGAAFGAFGPIMGLAAVGGPILAGWLVDANFFGIGWRMIFVINIPVGLLTMLGAARLFPASKRSTTTRLDLAGALLATLGTILMIYPLVQGREHGWPAWTFVGMAASLAVFAFFGWYESRRDRRGVATLVMPSLFGKRAFTGGLVAGLAFFSALVGFGLVFTLFVQLGLNYPPLKAGLASVPQALGMIVGFGIAGAGLSQKLGRTLIHIGTAITAAGFAVFMLVVDGPDVTVWTMAPATAIVGIGLGMAMAPFFDIVLAGVEEHETGSAAGTLTAVQQLGGALGVATLGTVFFSSLTSGFASAINAAVWVSLALLAASFALTFLLPMRARPED
ncbi:EmrB/QacA subfamily drug resistance transporter [Herbihabitans rhizosphaerae]|uniref:EmrB/QacA subfamily drug resistance transporter n=1 Tax=Herbihabitans rhizosphaerae TaxID=1872711 RepID=A0A4V2EUF4_9PSEU|nr:MFS transporter [Herbihabitans rhizosphaerae]RZS44383.1 EmrB/QacA subfamily drug resistance transporter [Herbihabitans rhizosphaerae]